MSIFNIEEKEKEYKITIEKFHIYLPKLLLYSKDDLWIKQESGSLLIGISDFFQLLLGDIMFVEFLKKTGEIKKNDEIGSLESLKTVLDIISPVTGKVTEVNPAIEKKPEILNKDPYNEGWVCKIQPITFELERKNLLSAEKYVQLVEKKYEDEKRRKAQQRKT